MKLYSTEDFGKFGLFISISTITSSFANLALDNYIVLSKNKTSDDRSFVEKTLKIKWMVDKINDIEKVNFNNSGNKHFQGIDLSFHAAPNEQSYYVEAPDIILPNDEYATQICEYVINKQGAGMVYDGNYRICALGFPFETIRQEHDREKLMNYILDFFSDNNRNLIPKIKTK